MLPPNRSAMDSFGNSIVVWHQDIGPDYFVFKSEYRNGIWAEPADLDDNLSINHVTSAAAPQAEIDNSGNAVITWLQTAWDWNQIFKAELRNGIWTGPVDYDDTVSFDEGNANYPWIAMNDQGQALISWSQVVTPEYYMFKAEFGF